MNVGNLERAMRIFAYYSVHAIVSGLGNDPRRLVVKGIHIDSLHPADVKRLEEWGFTWEPSEGGYFYSKEGW